MKENEKEEYATWAHLANLAATKEVRPELIQVDDEEFQEALNRLAQQQREKHKLFVEATYHFGRPVLGKILILPRSSARQFTYDKPWACISIGTFKEELPKINKVQLTDILQLTFVDLDAQPGAAWLERHPGEDKLFTSEQAKQIWEFVAKVWDDIDLLMIHCYAGISRSSAVGKAISEVYQPECVDYFGMLYDPNKLVHKILAETCQT